MEWSYVGEGGKHALFENKKQERFDGKLLRIKKRDIALSLSWSPDTERNFGKCCEDASNSDQRTDPLFYIRHVVAPKLSPYLDVPQLLQLDWKSLKSLRESTLKANVIPAARLKDWSPTFSAVDPPSRFARSPVGLLVMDYRTLPNSKQFFDNIRPPRRLSIELKPKAGFLAFSPLVLPGHRMKYLYSRFTLLQELHQNGHVEKGWSGTSQGVKRSYYDPLDLFSNHVPLMARAIQKLLASPQNNLRVWYNDRPIVHHSLIETQTEALYREVVQDISEKPLVAVDSEPTFERMLVEILCGCLSQESVLQQILVLQELDILDADGAILVFERLVELCKGSIEVTEKHLQELHIDSTLHPTHPLLCASPFSMEPCTENIQRLCTITARCKELLLCTAPSLPPSHDLDELHKSCTDIVALLSISECKYLLANWLLSLAMCDVSLFFTLVQVPNSNVSTKDGPNTETDCTASEVASAGDTKHITVSLDGLPVQFAYTVRVIDCDQKPPKKLRGRRAKESVFAKIAEK